MSGPGSFSASPDLPGPGAAKSADGGTRDPKDRNGAGSSLRERVLKEVGLTSTNFIGPAFPPEVASGRSDLEDTLSEFYKELEKIDTPDGADGDQGKAGEGSVRPPSPPKTSTSRHGQDALKGRSVSVSWFKEMDRSHQNNGQKQTSWPHWHQNEPYYHQRPRPDVDLSSGRADPNEWRYPQPPNRPPPPRSHTHPFHHPPHPFTFPDSHNPPPHVESRWSGARTANEYLDESRYATFSSLPAPRAYSPSARGHYGENTYLLDRDERYCSYDSVYTGWFEDRDERSSQFDEDYERWRRFVAEDELWEQEHHCRPPDNARASRSSLVLILMRGLPGSGKSTLARDLLSTGPDGLILSTDDYFVHVDGYRFDPGLLGVAHEWNQRRANVAMYERRSPVIIDNTNIQAWEMKPYVRMALERGYKVDFCEPDTCWKLDPYELEKRNQHGVPQDKIAEMLDRFSFHVSIDIVMSSQEPTHVNQRRRPEEAQAMRRSRDFL